MGFYIGVQPVIALGFAFHFMIPAIEIAIGPFLIGFGDIDKLDGLNDDAD